MIFRNDSVLFIVTTPYLLYMSKRIKISKRTTKKEEKKPIEKKVEPLKEDYQAVEVTPKVEEQPQPKVEQKVEPSIQKQSLKKEQTAEKKVKKETKPSRRSLREMILMGLVIGLSLVTGGLAYLYFSQESSNTASIRDEISTEDTIIEKADSNQVVRVDIIAESMRFKDFLTKNGVPELDIEVLRESANRYSWDFLEIGDKVKYYYEYNTSADNMKHIIYEPKEDPEVYYKMVVRDSLSLLMFKKKVQVKTQMAAVIIEETLIETVLNSGLRYDLLEHMEKALAWSIDFYDLKPGDRFKVIYDEKFIGGQSKEIVELKAIYFQKEEEEFYGYLFDLDGKPVFFDEQGSEMKKAFLKAPLKYGRLTSGFNLDRIHPVTGEKRAHLGTDYAAPEGTPIASVGDGVVIEAMFKANNGNYVKIQHDLKRYKTQYLHMSRFGEGIKVGTRVKQGQIIGYVGSTGLSTGPHVCFRFWKDNQQVDHRKENVAEALILPQEHQQEFVAIRNGLRTKLKQISF